MDDGICDDIFDSYHIQHVVTASIKAIYIHLGESDLSVCQDLVMFDKLREMLVSYSLQILGQLVNTQHVDVKTRQISSLKQ